jgi:hypothetical protein
MVNAKVTADEAKVLFQAYQETDDGVQAARKALESAMAERSAKVQAIVSKMGQGPFQWGGKVVKATKRDVKDDDGKVTSTTFFFKSIGDEVQTIG